jgi:hypothetical protein
VPRITRLEPLTTSSAVESDPLARQRSILRTVAIAAVLIALGVLVGFIVTRSAPDAGERRDAIASPSRSASAVIDPSSSAAPDASRSPEGGVAPASTTAGATGASMAPPVTTMGDRLTANGIELKVAWEPPTDGSRASRYDLEVARDSGAYRAVDLAKKTSRRATVPAAADHAYAFRLRMRAPDGTPQAWATSSVSLARHEEADGDVRASKGWKIADHPAYTGDGARYSKSKGAELSLAFDGSAVAIVGPTGPQRGRAEVFVDGERVGRFDTLGSSFEPVRLLFTVDGLTPGPHVMTIRVAGTPGRPMVAVDSFLVLGQP